MPYSKAADCSPASRRRHRARHRDERGTLPYSTKTFPPQIPKTNVIFSYQLLIARKGRPAMDADPPSTTTVYAQSASELRVGHVPATDRGQCGLKRTRTRLCRQARPICDDVRDVRLRFGDPWDETIPDPAWTRIIGGEGQLDLPKPVQLLTEISRAATHILEWIIAVHPQACCRPGHELRQSERV